MIPRIVPRRLYRGAVIVSSGSCGGLYNGSSGAELLVVWARGYYAGTNSHNLWANYQGNVGTLAACYPIRGTEASGPGQTTTGTVPSTFNTDWIEGIGPAMVQPAVPLIPFSILDPGWSLLVQPGNAETTYISFLFQVCHPEEVLWVDSPDA